MLCLFLSFPCQCLADGVRSLRQRFRKHMGIDIFRCPGVAVAEMLGDDFRWYAHVYQERGVRVAEVVDVYVGEIMLLQKPLELQVDVILAHVFPELPRENGFPVNPLVPDLFPAPVLPFPLLLQKLQCLWRQGHHPCAALCLGRGKPVFAVQTVDEYSNA